MRPIEQPDSPFYRPGQRHHFTARRARVASIRDLSSQLRRITLRGQELTDFASTGVSDHVRLFVPRLPDRKLIAPTPAADGIAPPPDGQAIGRDYTPRSVRTNGAGKVEVDIDFVLHQEPGPISSWAQEAEQGDEVCLVGPKGSRGVPVGATQIVLVVDATGLPAAARWHEETPFAVPIHTFVIDVDPRLAEADGYKWLNKMNTHWLDTGSNLAAAFDAAITPSDRTFIFAAAEATALIPFRRHLKDIIGLRREQLSIQGYWRAGTAGADHHAPLDPADPAAV